MTHFIQQCDTGGSHDRTDFLPLKHGLAIMALGAMAANPECDVKIVPVGVSFLQQGVDVLGHH